MKTIAIIPARGGSKRIPKKNIIPFIGKPLLAYSIEYAKANSQIIDDIYVSTDNDEIKKIALQYDVRVIDRPKHLSGDEEPTITALQHVLECLSEEIDIVILLQATSPLRPKKLLEETFNVFKKGRYDSLMTVSEGQKKLGKIRNGKYKPFTYKIGQRGQDLEALYYENGLLYISRADLIKKGRILGDNHIPFITSSPLGIIDIDTIEDLKLAEYYKNIFLE